MEAFTKVYTRKAHLDSKEEWVYCYREDDILDCGWLPRVFLAKPGTPETCRGFSTFARAEAEAQLSKGSFLIRPSKHAGPDSPYVLTIRSIKGNFKHIKLSKSKDGKINIYDQVCDTYDDLVDLFANLGKDTGRGPGMTPFKVFFSHF